MKWYFILYEMVFHNAVDIKQLALLRKLRLSMM